MLVKHELDEIEFEKAHFVEKLEVSTKNRSLHGTNPQSRGDSSLELEAVAAVHELSFAVKTISVSEILPRTADLIFVNVTTVEGQPYCLELTLKGWRVTSLRHDCMQGDYTRLDLFTIYYDTLYDLMDKLSPGYRNVFSEKLAQKLRMLQASEDDDFVDPAVFSANISSSNFTDDLDADTPIRCTALPGAFNDVISSDRKNDNL
uniref:GSKIP domain-containing protein n=1 Tax=Setaria digitata TaxID=48799 RepID=A0A915PJG1_9BILA